MTSSIKSLANDLVRACKKAKEEGPGIDIDAAHKTTDSNTWPDGTRKSKYNDFNWNTGEPTIFKQPQTGRPRIEKK